MFTVVRTTTNLSLDEHFLKNPAATFFVKVDGDGMEEHGIFKGDRASD
jgi:SOS-response transcriptional repressor LexA